MCTLTLLCINLTIKSQHVAWPTVSTFNYVSPSRSVEASASKQRITVRSPVGCHCCTTGSNVNGLQTKNPLRSQATISVIDPRSFAAATQLLGAPPAALQSLFWLLKRDGSASSVTRQEQILNRFTVTRGISTGWTGLDTSTPLFSRGCFWD